MVVKVEIVFKPIVLCDNVADYFVACLGVPEPQGRLEEMRQDYPLESECGRECQRAIDVGTLLLARIKAAHGLGEDLETIRQMVLAACETYCFG